MCKPPNLWRFIIAASSCHTHIFQLEINMYVTSPWPVGCHGMWLDLRKMLLGNTSCPGRHWDTLISLFFMTLTQRVIGKRKHRLSLENKRTAGLGVVLSVQNRERLSGKKVTQLLQEGFSKQDLEMGDSQDPSFWSHDSQKPPLT